MNTALTIDNAADTANIFIKSIPDFLNDKYCGRGIVICAGGIKYNPCAFVLIRMLRYLGCQLPIEVWHIGRTECDDKWIKLVEPFDVKCVDAQQVRKKHPHPCLRGWPLKPYAILHSRFQEVLFLDADNVPIKDPTYLFDSRPYRETGTVFWPDIKQSTTPTDSPRWQIFGVQPRSGPDQESGQILLDKSKCWKALKLCNWYNENSDFYYQHVYGDKDTFRFAWQRLDHPISWIPTGVATNVSYALIQHDFEGAPVFQHRFAYKWSLSRDNPRSARFQHEEQCLAFLDQLRQSWKPESLLNPGQSRRDIEQTQLLKNKQYEFQQVGFNRRAISFGDNFEVIQGRATPTRFWWMRCGSLVLATVDGRRHATLRKGKDGIWEGRTTKNKRVKIRLVPCN